jgi:SAM-dependent methyltransferase
VQEQDWDAMYRSRDAVWSGEPNPQLVAEVAGMTPGRALDLGCGEGADALWLAARGWTVTAVDISRVALGRAAADEKRVHAPAGAVDWRHADTAATPPQPGAYDLVSLQYFPVRREPGHRALRALLDAVAPGGTLLIGSHHHAEVAHVREAAQYHTVHDVADLLGDEWTITVLEERARADPAPAGTHHTRDEVLRAVRRADLPGASRAD